MTQFKKGKKKSKILLKILFAVLVLLVVMSIAGLLYNGTIWFNNPSNEEYPVRGIDVSAYQGDIDWELLSQQEIDFTFIKATEGSDFQDKLFAYNLENAMKTELQVGAYHFFSYDSQGETQAYNFINTVPKLEGMLPPVIDIEFYGDKEEKPTWQRGSS